MQSNIHIIYTALFKEWTKELGTLLIDYDTLTIERIIAKGFKAM